MERQTRKYIRLANYDYSSNGLYFITVCAKNRIHYFSEITEESLCVGEAALGLPYKVSQSDNQRFKDNINETNSFFSLAAFIPRPHYPQLKGIP